MDAEGKKELIEVLEKLLETCSYATMYGFLSSDNKKVASVSINSSLKDPGAYDPSTNKMTFKSNSTINYAFAEEFIHFFQQNHYNGGIGKYKGRKGETNIEFEAKLIMDIVNDINRFSGLTYGFNADSEYAREYLNWLELITKKGTKIPNYSDLVEIKSPQKKFNYWNFMEKFKEEKPAYNAGIDNSLIPVTINFLHLSDCNK